MGIIMVVMMIVIIGGGMIGGHKGHSTADTENKHKDSGIENHEASGNHQDAKVKVETEMQEKNTEVKKDADNPDKKNNIGKKE